jgi:hypothetical protein
MENKIIDYTVVNELSTDDLKEKVKELMKLMDWQPIGGLAVSFAPNQRPIFAQALVRYAKINLI